ncbi:MAG: sigma-70 family RNA polymerase sigma factor [Phycisphaeraceae bacterium]
MHDAQATTRDDDYERFTAALVANQPAIMGFVRTMLPRTSDAEDVLQKTCLIAWQKFDQFDPATKFSTWACQIAYFEVKNFLRTRARDRHVFSDAVLEALADEGPGEADHLADERVALADCVEALKPDERELLRRCYHSDATVAQIAEMLSRSANSVYKQLNRIRRRLLACITLRLQEGGAR